MVLKVCVFFSWVCSRSFTFDDLLVSKLVPLSLFRKKHRISCLLLGLEANLAGVLVLMHFMRSYHVGLVLESQAK